MKHHAAAAALAVLALFAGPAAADDAPALDKAPFMTAAPLATDTAQQIQQRIAALTDFPTVLDERVWTADHRMRPELAARIMQIANRIFSEVKLRNKAVSVADIELFGSNASYEYDAQADLGVQVFLSTANNPTAYSEDVLDLEHFMRLLTEATQLKQDGEVSFYGIPLTITFHATRGPGFRDSDGLPQYSIWSSDASRTGRWINPQNPPPPVPKDAFDRGVIATKAGEFVAQYNGLASDYFKNKQGFDCSRFGTFAKALKTYRKEGIAADGQRSNGNLTYRLLRRLSVNIPDLTDDMDRECLNIKDSLF